jgi:hypothetical protein
MELPDVSGGGTLHMTGEAEIDFTSERAHMTMEMAGEGASLAAVGGQSFEVISDGFTMYMKFPMLSELIPGTKEWIKVDLQAVGEDVGIDFSQLSQLGGTDPSQQLAYLEGMADVEKVGTEEVRGVSTTHYTGVVDFEALEEMAPDEAVESIRNLREMSGIDEAPMEVWLDDDGLPRRVNMEFTYDPSDDAPAGTPTGTMTMLLEYFDYGADIDIELPDDSDVTDMQELVEQAGG